MRRPLTTASTAWHRALNWASAARIAGEVLQIAFAFVAQRHHDEIRQPITGWMGHARPFDMERDYAPVPGVGRLASGTPGVLGLSALETALTAFDGVDVADRIRGPLVTRTVSPVSAVPAVRRLAVSARHTGPESTGKRPRSSSRTSSMPAPPRRRRPANCPQNTPRRPRDDDPLGGTTEGP